MCDSQAIETTPHIFQRAQLASMDDEQRMARVNAVTDALSAVTDGWFDGQPATGFDCLRKELSTLQLRLIREQLFEEMRQGHARQRAVV